jgi:Leucine-rich repeat (LRR) protein
MTSRLSVVLVSLLLATPAVIFWCWLVILPVRVKIICQEECMCDSEGYNVHCSGSSLNNIPLLLPTDLRKLLLVRTNITALVKDSFTSRRVTELETLIVVRCGLERIELGAFNGLTKLTDLTMSHNEISEIAPRTFEKMSRLRKLQLSYNRLEHLEVDIFSGLINLKRINLKQNKLQHLLPDMFVGLPHLEYIDLSRNPDLNIPTDRQFISSNSLAYLDISDCNVSSVSVETFANLSALKRLDLYNNNLRSVDINILKVLPKLSTLRLYGNRLQCDCQLQEVWRWCQEHNILTAYEGQPPECDTPSEVKGISWGVLEKGQCLQNNIYYYGDYEITSYSYTDVEDTDLDLIINGFDFLKYVKTPVYAGPFIFGTTGNAILLIIIICNKDMRTVPNMYILNLAISDMIYLTVHIAQFCADTISDTWKNSDFMCHFFPFCRRLSVGLSAYSVAVLSIQRYRVTVNPINVHFSSQQTWRATVATICGVWIVAALFALPSALSKRFCNLYQIDSSVTYYKKVVLFELLVSCVLPLCVIAFSYIMTARHLLKSGQLISEKTQNSILNTRKNTAAIVLGLTVVFLISYVPYHVLWTYVVFNIFSLSEHIVDKLIYTYLVSTCLLLLNPCLNPVALFCTSLALRRQFKRYLICCRKTNPTASNIELTRSI